MLRLSIFLCLLYLPFNCMAEETLSVTYGADYKPFAWGDNTVAFGIQKQFVEEVLVKRLGINVIHEACPWARCQALVKAGQKDAFFTVPTIERADYTEKTTLPFYSTRFVMHTSKHNPHIDRLNQIKRLEDLEAMPEIRHIYMLGSGWHDQALKNMQDISRIRDATKIPLLLTLNRADLYIEQAEMFRYQTKELGLQDKLLTFESPVIETLNWHLFIGKKSSKLSLLSNINQALTEMEESGELETIKQSLFKQFGVL